MRALAIVAVLGLAACDLTPLPAPDGLRASDAQISSSLRYNADTFEGNWHLIEVAGVPPFGDVLVLTNNSGMLLSSDVRSDLPPGVEPFPDFWAPTGPGRLVREASGEAIWVLWVDEDVRTAVLGNPEGSFAAILNRTARLRGDRLRAAREILAFNGYDLDALRPVRP